MRTLKETNIPWIGKIPGDWEVVKFKNASTFSTGKSIKDQDKDKYPVGENTLPYISTKNITYGTNEVNYNVEIFTKIDDPYFKIAPKNSILLCIEGGSAGKKITYLNQDVSYINKLCNFNPIGDNKFYYYYLQSNSFKSEFNLNLSGLIGGVSQSVLKDFSFIKPPLQTQISIAKYLDNKTNKISTFIKNKKEAIQLLQEQKQTIIHKAMTKGLEEGTQMKKTGNDWIPEIPESWNMRKFKGLTKILTCGLASTPKYVSKEVGIPFLSAQNVRPHRMDLEKYNYISVELHEQLTKYRTPEKGDVLVTRVGAGIGQACIIDIDMEFSVYVSLTHIRPTNEILSEYIVYFFDTDYAKKLNKLGTIEGGGQGNLNVTNVETYKIPLPPINIQKDIVEYLDEERNLIDIAISKIESEIKLIEEYRESLIYNAVTGKIEI